VALTRFQRWAFATTAATYGLIGVGGLVRASGSGLGCPDWPKCFDRWIPPLSAADVPKHIDPALFNFAKAWTEYANRLIGVAVGILIFVTLVLAIRHHKNDKHVLWPTALSFLLVGFEGWLGGQVVAAQLAPIVLSAHLAVALVIGGLLTYATVCAMIPAAPAPAWRRNLGRWTLAVIVLALAQVALGAIIRGEVQLLGKASPQVPRDAWLGLVGSAYRVHSTMSVVVVAAVSALIWRVFQHPAPLLRKTGLITIAVLALQPITGLGLAWFDLPAVLQVLHLWLGSLLVAVLMVLAILCYRVDQPTRIRPPGSA